VRCRRRLSDPALWQQQQRRPSTISTRIHHGASRLSPESLMRARGARSGSEVTLYRRMRS
jgi:hypothetical protein